MQSLQIKMRGEQKLLLGRPPSTRHQQVEEGEGEGGMDEGKVEGALGKREAGGSNPHRFLIRSAKLRRRRAVLRVVK